MGASGRLLSMASTSASRHSSSSCLIGYGDAIFFSWFFMARTPDSHKPPKWGVRAGLNCHWMSCSDMMVVALSLAEWRSFLVSLRSLLAPMKFNP